MGRPTKLTPETAARVVHHVLQGNYIKTACAEAGITPQTLKNWMARASELLGDPELDLATLPPEERIFVDFFAVLKVAEAGAESRLLRRAVRGEKGWQAAMTVLERRHPEMWGRSEKRIHEGSEERPIVFSLETDLERQQRVAGVLQRAGALEGSARELTAGEQDAP